MSAELLILGSAAGVPTANRHSTSMAIKCDGKLYLLDCGQAVSTQLKRMGEDPRKLTAVFLTHWHPDHASGLPMLLQDLELGRRQEPLPLFGPAGTSRKVALLQTIFLLPPERFPFQLNVCDYDDQTVFDDGTLRVIFFKTQHLAQQVWRDLDAAHHHLMQPIAYGFVIEVAGRRIVVSGDIYSSDDLLSVVPGADLLVHEFGHIAVGSLNQFAREQNIPHLLVTHLHHEWDQRGEELRHAVSLEHTGKVTVAEDGMRLTL
ncbi:MAG: ribonuclease Z [Herpetosiphon sp.]